MYKNKFVYIALFIFSILLSACGSNGPSTKLNVTFSDFKYDPMEFSIPAGKEITMTAKNKGLVEHEFVIMKFGQTAGDKFGDEDEGNIYWEVELKPGESNTVTFTAPPDPGVYEIICGTPGHLEAGMKGKLVVAAP